MAKKPTTSSHVPQATNLEEVRARLLEDKAEYRRHLARLPITEKFRILEEMRDFTAALQATRDENKARLKEAWTSSYNTP